MDYLDIFNATEDQYEQLMSLAGSRVDQNLVDISARTGYSLTGVKGSDPHAAASEYYLWDWEYAQTPAESSLIASAWVNISESPEVTVIFAYKLSRITTILMIQIKADSQKITNCQSINAGSKL